MCRVVFLPILACWWLGGTSPHSSSAQAPLPQLASADQSSAGASAAKRFLDMVAADFVGQIDFEYTANDADGTTRLNRGVLYCGGAGEVRLDVWLDPSSDEPLICCLADGRAWASFGDGEVVHETTFLSETAPDPGWRNRIWAMTTQVKSWKSMLVHAGLQAPASRRVVSSNSESGKLEVVVSGILTHAGEMSSPRITGEFSGEYSVHLPTCVTFDSGTLRLDRYRSAGSGKLLPGGVTWHLSRPLSVISTEWNVVDIVPSAPSDSAFHRLFDPASLPRLRLHHVHAEDGTERLNSVARGSSQ